MHNPAKIKRNGHYKQGYYVCKHPEKYMGDAKKIIYRSGLEQIVCYKFDHNTSIIGWCIEPLTINYISPKDGLPHRYFPDFLTVSLDKNGNKIINLWEVKPDKEKYEPKKGKNKKRYIKECLTYSVNQAKWDAARNFCVKKGWNFIIITEKEILSK